MFEFRVPYSQRYLFNAIPDTNHNANPTNPNCGKSSESVQCAMLKACDACADMGQL